MKLEIIIKKLTCDHDSYCNVKNVIGKKHCSKDYAQKCQTAKFYKRYGEEYLGIGAMVVPGGGLSKLFNHKQ